MSLQEIWQRIEARYGAFSPQLRRAARFVRENPQDVALHSLRTLSRQAGVSPTSMTRLMQALDIDNWDAFQAAHRAWLTAGRQGAFSDRADRVISGSRGPGAEDLLLDAMAEAEGDNVSRALASQARRSLVQAADMLVAAPAVAIAGIRSCFPVAFSLHYSLSLFMPHVRLMTGIGSAPLDELHHLRENDCLVVVSVAPYSRETVDVARHARNSGVRVVTITDGPLSPIARLADVTLVAANESPAHIASPIGPIAAAQALAILVLARAGDGALDALRRREATFEAISAYLPEEPKP
ncbi:MurR/RpiR family transcriptional regulator [Neoaquamicrobium sediminum]|uniref:MurR/RpiR family transcriptional regulator n=1 Tax=Neoaquamicrobium sediminum TaxID=1849104 RepID=UPI001563CE23|nr:MurR/RpiR family transcriptional regulator [Mesorhizobium sediminum]NRC53501.1 MurR/RpiR family transcriptional regulator [Mesorhizobium sediminum]